MGPALALGVDGRVWFLPTRVVVRGFTLPLDRLCSDGEVLLDSERPCSEDLERFDLPCFVSARAFLELG